MSAGITSRPTSNLPTSKDASFYGSLGFGVPERMNFGGPAPAQQAYGSLISGTGGHTYRKLAGGGYVNEFGERVSGITTPSRGGGGGGGGGGYGGGGISMQGAPVEFYLGPAPKLSELNLNFEELGKRAMETNKPYAEQYKQFAPGTEAGTRAISNLGATMATGQLSQDMASQIGRGAAQLGFSTGLGGRSGIGRNILARDLGLGTLQVQQQGLDFLNRSSQLAQQAQQAMSPIAPTEVFGTAANQASINQQIQNQNLLNAWLSQGLPGQFDITKGQFIGFQPGSYATSRPVLPGTGTTNWTGSAGLNYRYG